MIKFSAITNFTATPDYDLCNQKITEIETDSMAGWLKPERFLPEVDRIKAAAAQINQNSKYLVCIGIGGSYLGHRAVIEMLEQRSSTKILYAGNSLSSRELQKIIDEIGEADFSVNVISKSGTTTEPAIAFRIFKQKLIEKYGVDEAYRRIYATTDAKHGALHDESVENHYTTFVVPDDIGGRYSVLSPVGLLPLAVAGIGIEKLIAGASDAAQDTDDAVRYATYRSALAKNNYDVEVLASFEPSMCYFGEWWKQLFGESEGKERKGIFPASVCYTTDLHSLGQYMQDGRRNIFETFIRVAARKDGEPEFTVLPCMDNLDGLAYLEGKSLNKINATAQEATIKAHADGGIPIFVLDVEGLDEYSVGGLIFFFEFSCALSAKLQGINPFDQPGVESYKKNMFHLLGKPGF